MKNGWVDILGYEGGYQIHPDGHIKALARTISRGRGILQKRKERIMKIHNNADGYPQVRLRNLNGDRRTISVHRLIATTFIPNPNHLPEVNHINAIKTDNSIHNLEWMSHKENVCHAFGLGIGNINQKVMASNGIVYESIQSAAEALHLGSGHVYDVLNGKLKHARGFTFRRFS